jgi:putative two-component system response regulator
MGVNALIDKYDVTTLGSGERLLSMLEKQLPDLILLDVEMPGMNGYETITRIKGNPKTADIPVIFLTIKSEGENELEGLSLGAVDYIGKPFSAPLLLKRIELHLQLEEQKQVLIEQQNKLKRFNENLLEIVAEKTEAVLELQNSIIKTIANLVECRDDVTGAHIERTQMYLRILIDGMREKGIYLEETAGWDVDLILQSAQLHDLGKIAISDSILRKPGKLTPEEFEIIKTHTTFGEEVIEKIMKDAPHQVFLEQAKILASSHHEKWDGSGYPRGLKGMEIPLQGRLMAIADVYDALVSDRPYKKAFTHEEAVRIIKEGSWTHFDPVLVELLLSVADEFRKVGTYITKA